MKSYILTFTCLLFLSQAPSVNAQESKPTNFPVPDTFSDSVNDLDYQKKNISMTDQAGNVIYKSPQDIDNELNDMIRLYKAEKYAEAYPIVSELSQWGIKDAQAILGGMFLKGEHVDQSTERGLLWLGVAKEESNQKSAAKSFDYVYEQLSPEHKAYMDQKVTEHIAKFGSKAQHIKCKRESEVGSNLKTMRCDKTSGSNATLHPIP
ncbi:MAG: hypothetical protein KTR16_06550 [Acidiferrobacterales bacterium]|nr:hypothetical protein [Acidiferrobacterales bacterium]